MNEELSSAQLISHHRTREDYRESPANTLQFGYGDHRYVKFTYELLNQSDILKEKILRQVQEDFSLCNNVDLCLKSSDLMSVLYKHLKHENLQIRWLSTRCITKICASPFGRKKIIKEHKIEQFEQMIFDDRSNIRQSTLTGLINFAQFIQGIDHLLESPKILNDLVGKLIQQKNEKVLASVVKLLKILMQGEQGTPNALKTEIISRLMNLIENPSEEIRYEVCMTLANISFNEMGKYEIVTKGYIKSIAPRLKDSDALVREAVCLLLCSLAQLNSGKIQILKECEFQVIIGLLDDTEPTVLNCVQLIGNLAENPVGRELAENFIQKIDGLTNIERVYIDTTLNIIKWKP